MSKQLNMKGTTAFLPKSQSVVIQALDNVLDPFTIDKDAKSVNVKPVKELNTGINSNIEIPFVEWGIGNDLPIKIIKRIQDNIQLGANTNYNVLTGYGQGIMVVKKVKVNGKVEYEEQLESEQPAIYEFLENNNYERIIYDSILDLDMFSRSYRELIFSRENKLVRIAHKEASYSRVSQMNEKSKIEYHGYNYQWHKRNLNTVSVTKLLDEECPQTDLKIRRGKLPGTDGKSQIEKDTFRYILPLGLPTPARVYYPNPFYWSVFRMGWDQIANVIPKYKTTLMRNKIQVPYIVYISESFWEKLYMWENASDDDKKKEGRKKFLKQLDEFLAGAENAGKAFVTEFVYNNHTGSEMKDIVIEPLKKSGSATEGGDWIEDNEEATNMICLAKLNHVSLIGAAPGKNSKINGTEARELFIIKQAMMQPIRNELVKDLYMAKYFNGWDRDLHFIIPNIELTTLDKGTGAVKSIGSQAI